VRIARVTRLEATKIDACFVLKELKRLQVVTEIRLSRLAGETDVVEMNPVDSHIFDQFGHQADFISADFRQGRIDRSHHFPARANYQPFGMLSDLPDQRPFRENTKPGMNHHVSPGEPRLERRQRNPNHRPGL